jgi:hypothetical protein
VCSVRRYAIIVPAVLVTYLLGSNLSILELFINLVGGILFIAVGAITIQNYQHQCKLSVLFRKISSQKWERTDYSRCRDTHFV